MSTTLSIEHHLNKSKIVIYLIVRRFCCILCCCNSFTPHKIIDLIKFHRVRKTLLVVHSFITVWSFCQLIHQMLNAQYGHLQIQCILAKMCICCLKLCKLITYPPHDCFHHIISQVGEVNKLLEVIHQLFPSLRVSMNLIYHMIWDNFHSCHGKSQFVGNNNMVLVVILMIGTL